MGAAVTGRRPHDERNVVLLLARHQFDGVYATRKIRRHAPLDANAPAGCREVVVVKMDRGIMRRGTFPVLLRPVPPHAPDRSRGCIEE